MMASNRHGLGKRQRNNDGSSQRPPKQPRQENSDPSGTGNGQASLSHSMFEHAPLEVSVAKFAESRARELEALTKAVEQVAGNKLSFQRLPKHMRRRAMSHNIRRIPRRLRERAQAELEKREKKGASKRPSRRFRRRPSNLLSEYDRRQRRHMWLETHIWHAKRFKMTTAWGYRLPLHPSDKSLRACYRASTHHCLLQDVSYECCIEIRGPHRDILDALGHLTSKDTGLTFGAKVNNTGQRWGKVVMYACDTYPHGALVPVTFLWHPPSPQPQQKSDDATNYDSGGEQEVRTLWLWCHPAAYVDVWNQLTKACTLLSLGGSSSVCDDHHVNQSGYVVTQSKSPAHGGTRVQIGALRLHSLKDQMVKFRLSGPASSLVLSEVLKPANIRSEKTDAGSIRSEKTGAGRAEDWEEAVPWWVKYYEGRGAEEFGVQAASWQRVAQCQSPGEVPPRAVLALTVRDPRILLPAVRTKAASDKADSAALAMTWDHLPAQTAASPLLDEGIRQEVSRTKLPEQEINRQRSKLLVPGSVLQLGNAESRIPVLLLQHPGSQSMYGRQNTTGPRSAVGSGWDLVAPKSWAMAFWIAMVYRGARVGGLRESRSLAVRASQLYFPHDFPDSASGSQLQRETRSACVEKYVRRPPAKRVNFRRLGVPAPFHCPWAQLVGEWRERVQELLTTGGKSHAQQNMPLIAKEESLARPEEKPSGEIEWNVSDSGDAEKERSPYSNPYILRCRQLLRALQDVMTNAKYRRSSNVTKLSVILAQPLLKALVEKHLNSLVPFAVSCQSRGVPLERAMICLPLASDLAQLAQDPKFPDPTENLHPCSKTAVVKKKKGASCVGASSDKQEAKTGDKVPKDSLNPRQLRDQEEMMKEPSKLVGVTDRPIIGFLTNGDFDLGQGHGAGVGLCCLGGVLGLLGESSPSQPSLVLVRNPTSLQYRFATLSLLS